MSTVADPWAVAEAREEYPQPNYSHCAFRRLGSRCIADELPVGAICCADTPERELLACGEGFFTLHGYSRQEVEELFHNRLAELIHPEDQMLNWSRSLEPLTLGDTRMLEYRVCCRDGQAIWVQDQARAGTLPDGQRVLYCTLIDVTKARADREALRLSMERNQIIMDQAIDIIFEWDVESDSFEMSDNWEKKFGYAPRVDHVTDWLADNAHFHPDDRKTIREMMRKALGNETYIEGEYRVVDHKGRYTWCRSRVTLQRDAYGAPKKAVGIISDIDMEKRENQKLREMADRDPLTGLYNKGAVRKLVERHLKDTRGFQRSAFLMIDMDNFKNINDTYGHLGGDALLSDAAAALGGLFRSGDVVGRIGGDEFCVLMPGIPDEGVARRKAAEILDTFRHLVTQRGAAAVTTSVGVAVAPEDGADYDALLHRADVALYRAKELGKNQYVRYGCGMELRGEMAAAREAERERLDSEQSRHFGGELGRYVFRALYEAEDVERALPLVLEIIGRQTDVSRVYVCEFTEDGSSVRVTCDWHEEGDQAWANMVPTSSLLDQVDALRENGAFYIRDTAMLSQPMRGVLEAQGIRSRLACGLWDGRELRGAVALDECRASRLWTQEQVDTLNDIARTISVFLLRRRAQVGAERMLESLRAVLDHQQEWIYVLDPETHRFLYANRAVRELIPNLREGAVCHDIFYQCSHPCEYCPLEQTDRESWEETERYSVILDAPVTIQVKPISWMGDREARLITCRPSEHSKGEKE